MSWLIMCLNILPKNIFTVFVEIDVLLMQNNLRTVIFWDTIMKFLSTSKHQVLCQCSGKMYIGQAMITCVYPFFDDYVVSFCLRNMFLRVLVHMYRRRLQYCNPVHCCSKVIVAMLLYHLETPHPIYTYYIFNGCAIRFSCCWWHVMCYPIK